jgi:TonB family protein
MGMKNQKMKPIILTQRPEEIQGDMNFDKVLSRYRILRLRKVVAQYGIPLLMAIGAGTYFLMPESSENTKQILPVEDSMVTEIPDNFQMEETIPEELSQKQLQEPEINEPVLTEVNEPEPVKIPEEKDQKKQESYNPEVAVSVFTNAEPVKGYEDLYQYFDDELDYPDTLVAENITGTVIVRFAIGRNGRPEQIRVQKSLHPLLDKEAMRLIREMPDWKPATANGTAVNSFMSIPITFNITKNE